MITRVSYLSVLNIRPALLVDGKFVSTGYKNGENNETTAYYAITRSIKCEEVQVNNKYRTLHLTSVLYLLILVMRIENLSSSSINIYSFLKEHLQHWSKRYILARSINSIIVI
jgi:hypothetical protein